MLAVFYLPYFGIEKGIVLDFYKGKDDEILAVANVRIINDTDSYLLLGDWNETSSVIKNNVKHRPYDSYYDLSNNEKIIYDEILSNLIDLYNTSGSALSFDINIDNMDLAYKFTSSRDDIKSQIADLDITGIFKALHKDYDWLFWFSNGTKWSAEGPRLMFKDGKLYNSYFTLNIDPENCYQDAEKIKTDSLLLNKESNLIVEEFNIIDNDMKKVKEIGRLIINKITYNSDLLEKMLNNETEANYLEGSSVVEFFKKDNPLMVCSGYANVFQMICDLCDIECYKVTGTLNNLNHAWNVVVINGQMYFVDLTNSDTGTIGEGGELFFIPVDNINECLSINIKGKKLEYSVN